MIVRQLRNYVTATERKLCALVVELDIMRTGLVELTAIYRAEHAELRRQIAQDIPEVMLAPAYPPKPTTTRATEVRPRRKRQPKRKHKRR